MKSNAYAALLLIALLVMIAEMLTPKPAACSDCLALSCSTSAQCPINCFCAIPYGSIFGHCAGMD